MNNLESLRYLPSEIVLSIFLLVVLFAGLLSRGEGRESSLFLFLGVVGLASSFFIEASFFPGDGRPSVLFHGLVRNDHLARLFKLILLPSSLFLLLFSHFSSSAERKYFDSMEYTLLVLANALGMMLLASAANLLMVYLSFEFLSLTAFLLVGFVDREERNTEAAIKYLLYGGVASGVMLYGLSLLYGMAGTLDYAGMREFFLNNDTSPVMLYISLLFVLVGMGYKIAAFPFHSWCPDVYEGAPTAISAFLSVGSKVAGFAFVFRFFFQVFGGPVAGDGVLPFLGVDWSLPVAVLSALSMTVGNLAALRQRNIKRMLAYSSIAHAGYILMAVASRTSFGVSSAFFYLVVYFVMNLGAFLVVILVSREFHSELIEDYEGLGWKSGKGAFLATMFAVYLFSLTGIPPFAGFIGKAITGQIDWLMTIPIVLTVIPSAHLGSLISRQTPVSTSPLLSPAPLT